MGVGPNHELMFDGLHIDLEKSTCVGSIGFASPIPLYTFLDAIAQKIPDIIILVPWEGAKLKWVTTKNSDYGYSDIDQLWVDEKLHPFRFKDRYHNQHGNIAKVYSIARSSTHVLHDGNMVEIAELQKQKIDNESKIRELEAINATLDDCITKGIHL